MKILIVEDNQFATELIAGMLKSFEVEYDTACDGITAIEKFKMSKNKEYDLVFIDVIMPEINGFEAAEKIRELDRPDAVTVPIIAVTAYTSNKAKSDLKASGFNGMITKPISFGSVKKMIEKYCEQQDAEFEWV